MRYQEALLAALFLLAGCEGMGTSVKVQPIDNITLGTPLGKLVFSFAKEQEKATASPAELAKKADATKGSLLFRAYDFSTGPLPEGCKDFQSGRYGNFELTKEDTLGEIEKSVDKLEKGPGAPDEAVIALAVYKAPAFRSLCGPVTKAKLKPGSAINGWLLNERSFQAFAKINAEEIDVTPRITIIALEKSVFDRRRLDATAANLLLSRYRYDVPPNTDSLAFDPKTGSTLMAYSQALRDVAIDGATRDALTGGVVRIFVGARYLYVVEFTTNTAGISDTKWNAFQSYVDSFRYVAPAK